MKVVGIRPGVEPPAPKVDKELVAHLEEMLAAAQAGEIQGYLCAYIRNDLTARWLTCDSSEIAELALSTRRALNELEAEDE